MARTIQVPRLRVQKTSFKEVVARFQPEANALAPREVVPMHKRASETMMMNVSQGTTAVLRKRNEIAKHVPRVDWSALELLPGLGAHLFLLSKAIDRRPAPRPSLTRAIARVSVLRTKLLTSARLLAASGVLKPEVVARFGHERGAQVRARELDLLVSLFQEHAASLQGKSPVTEEDLREAQLVAAEALRGVTPKSRRGLRRPLSDEVRARIDARDRMFTILSRYYEEVWRLGAWVYRRDEIEKKVPRLGVRRWKKPRRAAKRAAAAKKPRAAKAKTRRKVAHA